MSSKGWVGFNLDGTLAHYDGWKGIAHVGEPVPAMAAKLREYIAAGTECRIFTARVHGDGEGAFDAWNHIRDWCFKHFGVRLQVTNEKDPRMIALYDDRCVAVETNTGRIIGGVEPL